MRTIPGSGKGYTYGEDEWGEYGTIFSPEEDERITPPVDPENDAALDQAYREAVAAEEAERNEKS